MIHAKLKIQQREREILSMADSLVKNHRDILGQEAVGHTESDQLLISLPFLDVKMVQHHPLRSLG